jgi:CheY-like chemotaxis protein/HPt (histidine-containing phosphotransfer) domain-containing protein
MGGDIGVISKEGEGATFWFEIPLEIGDTTADTVNSPPTADLDGLRATVFAKGRGFAPPPTVEAALADGRLILVAEDNAANRLVIGKQLSLLGYAYDMVEDGEEAWMALAAKPYGLLLSDCFMPRLDGYQLAQRIRTHEYSVRALHPLPIVALTANALADDAPKCLAAGMSDYLSKPVTLDRLGEILARWLPAASEIRPVDLPELEPDPDPDPRTEARACGDDIAPVLVERPIDLAGLADILGAGNNDLFAEVLGFFVESFAELDERIAQAVASRDRAHLRDAAHAAKGASLNAAAKELAETMQALEMGAARQSWRRLEILMRRSREQFATVRGFVATLSPSPI